MVEVYGPTSIFGGHESVVKGVNSNRFTAEEGTCTCCLPSREWMDMNLADILTTPLPVPLRHDFTVGCCGEGTIPVGKDY